METAVGAGAGAGGGLRAGEGQAGRLPCLLRDKRSPQPTPVSTLRYSSRECGPGPSTSFSPGWGVLGFGACRRIFIIASKQLALKKIEMLVLVPVCVWERSGGGGATGCRKGQQGTSPGAGGAPRAAGSGLPASRGCGDSGQAGSPGWLLPRPPPRPGFPQVVLPRHRHRHHGHEEGGGGPLFGDAQIATKATCEHQTARI